MPLDIQKLLKAELRRRGIIPNFDLGVNPDEAEKAVYMSFMSTAYVHWLFDEYKNRLCADNFTGAVTIFLKTREKIKGLEEKEERSMLSEFV